MARKIWPRLCAAGGVAAAVAAWACSQASYHPPEPPPGKGPTEIEGGGGGGDGGVTEGGPGPCHGDPTCNSLLNCPPDVKMMAGVFDNDGGNLTVPVQFTGGSPAPGTYKMTAYTIYGGNAIDDAGWTGLTARETFTIGDLDAATDAPWDGGALDFKHVTWQGDPTKTLNASVTYCTNTGIGFDGGPALCFTYSCPKGTPAGGHDYTATPTSITIDTTYHGSTNVGVITYTKQ